MPNTPRSLQKNTPYTTLTNNTRNAYANTLAQAIHKHHGIPHCTPQIPQGETPNFRIVGAHQHTKPRALDTHHPHQPKYGIPHAHIQIGGFEYDQALASMLPDLFVMWFKWLHTNNAPSLTRTLNHEILLDDANWHHTGLAAHWILQFAWIDTHT